MKDFMMCLYCHGGVKANSLYCIKICHQFGLPAMRMCEGKKEVMRFHYISSVMSLVFKGSPHCMKSGLAQGADATHSPSQCDLTL